MRDDDSHSSLSEEEIRDSRKRSVWSRRCTLTQRITSRLWEFDELDPYQIFKVKNKRCLLLRVQVSHGEGIGKGWWSQLINKPNPYLILHLRGTPNGSKMTPVVYESHNPMWNVCFQFLVDPIIMHDLHITLMDSSFIKDRTIGTEIFEICKLKLGTEENVIVKFVDGSKVFMTICLVKSLQQDLRFSLSLSREEINFVRNRRTRIFRAMQRFLGLEDAPQQIREVPVIAVLNSGGGVRAAIASCGVYKALYDSGLLDCTMYVAGLSGSSWYLTYLYTHPDFPEYIGPGDLISDIREKFATDWTKLLTLKNVFSYLRHLARKRIEGQSISFTDFYGLLLGEMLLGEQKNSKLSQLKNKLVKASIPMPLFTCVVAKENVSARVFQEYVEFSPYEVGLPKYGAFMKTENFGSKFYVGKIVKRFDELPFHYLIGVWGSAFTILFKRLIDDEKRTLKLMQASGKSKSDDEQRDVFYDCHEIENEETDDEEIDEEREYGERKDEERKYEKREYEEREDEEMKEKKDKEMENDEHFEDCQEELDVELAELITTLEMKKSVLRKCDDPGTETSDNTKSNVTENPAEHEADFNEPSGSSNVLSKMDKPAKNVRFIQNIRKKHNTVKEMKKKMRIAEESESEEEDGMFLQDLERQSSRLTEIIDTNTKFSEESDTSEISYEEADYNRRNTFHEDIRMSQKASEVSMDVSFWQSLFERSMQIQMIGGTRAGRAGAVFNPLRALSLIHTYPISPTFDTSTDDAEEDFQGTEEPIEAYAKKLCLVDAGLVFNSPFPLLLRPQRAVDVFISFDYSSRPADFHEAFGELILAEKWAIRNNVTFPPIQELVEKYFNEPMRELYVFKHPENPYCPIIVHCIIFNGCFKEYKAPNVKRETPEELQFADFKIFSDQEDSYSSFKYTYTTLQFDRLCKLMEFNTLNGMKVFRKILKYAVKRKRKLLTGQPFKHSSL